MEENISIGRKIKSIRISLGDNMEDFGKRLSPPATKGTISKWENGKYIPNNERLRQIAELGDVTVSFLLHGNTSDFLVSNLKNLLPSEYKFISRIFNIDWIFYLSKKIDEQNVNVFEVEKIKSIVEYHLPKVLSDFEKYHRKMANFILNNKKYKERCIMYFKSGQSSFDITGIEKVSYIFENANNLTLEEMVSLHSNIEDIHSYLDSISNNRPFFIESNAFILDEDSLKKITYLDFENDTQLETYEVFYKESNNPFPHKFEKYDLLVRINDDGLSESVDNSYHILVHYLPNLTEDLLFEYFVNKQLAFLYNEKIYIGKLDDQLNLKGNNFKLDLKSQINGNRIFPLAAIYY